MNTEIISGIAHIGNVEDFLKMLNELAKKHRVIIQVLDADQIASRGHLQFAVDKAKRAMQEGRNISKDLGIEILLYASGKRQIEQAIAMGVHPGKNDVAVVIIGDDGSTIAVDPFSGDVFTGTVESEKSKE